MYRSFATLFCWLFFLSVSAQINESDTAAFQLQSSLAGIYQEGNVNILSIRGRLNISTRFLEHFVLKSQTSNLYQEFSSRKADNHISNQNFLYFKPEKRFYPFAMGFVSSDFRQRLDLRYFAGVGVTGQLIRESDHLLKLSLSTVYESSDFRDKDFNIDRYDGNHQIDLWRGTFYLNGWNDLMDKKVRLFYEAYWQPAFEDFDNYRILAEAGLQLPIWKGFSFRVIFTYLHENVVPQGVKEDDRILLFGFNYQYKTIPK